jgi:hypothetical protein
MNYSVGTGYIEEFMIPGGLPVVFATAELRHQPRTVSFWVCLA